jgi:hypothetical protein
MWSTHRPGERLSAAEWQNGIVFECIQTHPFLLNLTRRRASLVPSTAFAQTTRHIDYPPISIMFMRIANLQGTVCRECRNKEEPDGQDQAGAAHSHPSNSQTKPRTRSYYYGSMEYC